MTTAHAEQQPSTPTPPLHDRILFGLQAAAVAWLFFTGMWSGPSLGATLAYPHGFLAVETGLALLLIMQGIRGRVRSPRTYPFFWPCLAVLMLCLAAAAARVAFRGTAPDAEAMRLWQHGEPMLRGLLLFLAIAGQPTIFRTAWMAVISGMSVHILAAIVQHITHVSRWYADLDRGWADGWQPWHSSIRYRHGALIAPRVQGLTSYINLSAALFAAYLPLWWAAPALRVPRTYWKQCLLVAGGMASVAALWYTGSRGPLLAIMVGALLLLWHLSTHHRFSLLAGIFAFVITVWLSAPVWALTAFLMAIGMTVIIKRRHLRVLLPVAIGLGLAGGIQVLDAYCLRYHLSWRVMDLSFADTSRFMMCDDAIQTALSSPWWGIGDTEAAQRVINLPNRALRRLPLVQQNYHNQPLHWAASDGLVVAMAFTVLVCWASWWCWQQYRRRPDPAMRAIGLACALGATIFLLSNITEAHFWRIEGGGFFWSLLALAAAAGTMASPARASDRCAAVDQPAQEPADEIGGDRG